MTPYVSSLDLKLSVDPGDAALRNQQTDLHLRYDDRMKANQDAQKAEALPSYRGRGPSCALDFIPIRSDRRHPDEPLPPHASR